MKLRSERIHELNHPGNCCSVTFNQKSAFSYTLVCCSFQRERHFTLIYVEWFLHGKKPAFQLACLVSTGHNFKTQSCVCMVVIGTINVHAGLGFASTFSRFFLIREKIVGETFIVLKFFFLTYKILFFFDGICAQEW